MAEAEPKGPARFIAHTYRYNVSDAWIQRRIDEDGIEPPSQWQIKFELRELPDAPARRRARNLRERWEGLPGTAELAKPTEDPEEFLDLLAEWLEAVDDRDEAPETDFEGEMGDWIEQKGSIRLKLARSRGYKVTSSYAKERAREELPECWVDTARKAAYRERVDPSMRALIVETKFRDWIEEQELNLDTRIVWLTSPPSSMEEYREEDEDLWDAEFEQQETLLIPSYLGKYNVYLPIDIDERTPRDEESESESDEEGG